ncbi:hypothetical protein AB4114_29745 [Paenibacillus sp. 2RAB27]|uniref:hypothetical protein n=1 Tax=Paenibacillus sp. 2RAB27 TaxID=3232991 RepID=UPI003F9DD681
MSIQDELKNTKGDYVHATVKAAASSVPVVGGLLSEVFGLVVAAPADKRKENIIILLDERLREIEAKVDSINLDDLATNDRFLSTVLQVIQISMRTHQTVKRVALINAATNAAVSISIEENLQQMFLNFIDSFNEWHLKLLHFLNDPFQQLKEGGQFVELGTGGVRHIINMRFPELVGQKEFTNQIVNDLYSRGLISSNSDILNATMSWTGMVAPRTSDMGRQFLLYITTPSFLEE